MSFLTAALAGPGHGRRGSSRTLRISVLALTLFIAQLIIFLPVQARTIYIDAAHVHLPNLRRILSFGGRLNGQPQDSIVSLDLSTTWKVSQPAISVLTTSLTEPASKLIPHVTRATDGTYTIALYGSEFGDPASAKNNKVRYWKITTKDGKSLDSLVPAEVGTSAWAPLEPCKSTTAAPLSEIFSGAVGVQEDVAVSYMYGGYPRNSTTRESPTSLVLTELSSRASAGDGIKALPVGDWSGPRMTTACALAYIAPKKLLVHASLRNITSGVFNPVTYDLVNMRWAQYNGAYPDTPRAKNQFVLYPKSPSGRSYVLSVGSSWGTGSSGSPISSIWYSELDGEKAWVNATVYGDPEIMTHHGTVVVDNQVLVLGYTSDTSANQAATAVAVFEITERTPGTLEFRWSDQFVPSALGSGDAEGDANIKSGSSSSAIPAGSVVGGVGLVALLAYFGYRRIRKPSSSPVSDPPPISSTSNQKPDLEHTSIDVSAFPSLPPMHPAAGTTGRSVSDDMLFGPRAHADPAEWSRPPPASFQAAAQFGSLPPAPPAPEPVVDERVQLILDGHGNGDRAERLHGQFVVPPAPAALTGRP